MAFNPLNYTLKITATCRDTDDGAADHTTRAKYLKDLKEALVDELQANALTSVKLKVELVPKGTRG